MPGNTLRRPGCKKVWKLHCEFEGKQQIVVTARRSDHCFTLGHNCSPSVRLDVSSAWERGFANKTVTVQGRVCQQGGKDMGFRAFQERSKDARVCQQGSGDGGLRFAKKR